MYIFIIIINYEIVYNFVNLEKLLFNYVVNIKWCLILSCLVCYRCVL